ncbi:MAG: hypothetical protein EA397_08855 [Deltaproteobacteria bacterium]|nr:MAG: hypothetical protein EA397_08855 [Deltaproteobacteria bacterium]
MSRTLVLLLSFGVGCVPKTYQEAQSATESRVAMMSNRQAVFEQSLEEQSDKLDQLHDALRARGRSEAEALENLEQVADRLRTIRGDIEGLRFGLEDLQRDVRDYMKQQERRQLHDELRLKQIERALGLTAPPLPELDPEDLLDGLTDDEPDEDETPDAASLPESAGGKLERAIEEMQKGRQGVARFVLERGVEEHAGHALEAEMRYRIGETYANEKSWIRAANAFDQVVTNHPKSSWAAWSMLRTGEAFLELGRRDGAILFFEDTVRLYPKSEAATEAKAKLEKLQ